MNCRVDQRLRAEHAAAILDARPLVLDVATVPASEDPTDSWLVDVVLHERAGGLPSTVGLDVARLELTVRDVSPQGEFWHALLTV